MSDEGTTECYAVPGIEIEQRLGLAVDTARRMMRQQLVENVLRSQSSPAYRVPRTAATATASITRPDMAGYP